MRKDQKPLALSFHTMLEVRNIPTDRLKWLDRVSEREKLPEDYFLDPKNRKYPFQKYCGGDK